MAYRNFRTHLDQAQTTETNDLRFLLHMLKFYEANKGEFRVPTMMRNLAFDCSLRCPLLCTYDAARARLTIHKEHLKSFLELKGIRHDIL